MPKTCTYLVVFLLYFASLIITFNTINGKEVATKKLKINIFSDSNGRGLETDQNILKNALERLGHTVNSVSFDNISKPIDADINIFIEFITLHYIRKAKTNWFIPNPEWYRQNLELLDQMDLILCRTKEVERIFQQLNKKTFFLSFTSPDCYREEVEKDYELCAHLPGASIQKGTAAITNIWESNPQFPPLVIVNFLDYFLPISLVNLTWIPYRLPVDEFRVLQNHCGLHLCLSETEGFGHYLMEAMSTGAVVVTTDAPPMNEFINDPRCLVPYSKTTLQRLATNYYVDQDLLEAKINSLMQLSHEELRRIGLNNRKQYLKTQQEFYSNLEKLLLLPKSKKNSACP